MSGRSVARVVVAGLLVAVLRLAPARNNQRLKIRMAEDYTLVR